MTDIYDDDDDDYDYGDDDDDGDCSWNSSQYLLWASVWNFILNRSVVSGEEKDGRTDTFLPLYSCCSLLKESLNM
jgi:hypothetical protein